MKKKSTVHDLFKIILASMVLFSLGIANPVISQHTNRATFIHGADGSIIDQIEQSGGKFYDEGTEKSAIEIFKKYGFNLIRLKLWHTPDNQYNSLPNMLKMAKKVNDAGLTFMLDFHYSDTWADPGHQTKPAVWNGLQFNTLSDSIYEYTKYVISELKAQNTLPEYVQIGNEITCGLLWDDGKVCNPDNTEQWSQLGTLIKKAIQGLEDATESGDQIKTIIHIDKGGNNGAARWFYDNLIDEGVEFDIIGLSFYNWWHGTLTDLKNNLNDLANRYNKDIMVVEGAYPWTLGWGDNTNNIVGSQDALHEGYPATVQGQKEFLEDMLSIIHDTDNDKGKGFVYWSPEWIPGFPGSPWENLALFDFDGEVLESIKAFQDQSGIDDGITVKPFLLHNPYPVPFSTTTSIEFSMNSKSPVELTIYDAFGREVVKLIDEKLNAGEYSVQWDASANTSGVYYVVFRSKGFQQTSKIILQ